MLFTWCLLFLCLQQAGAALEMTGPTSHTAMVGQEAHIPCTFTDDTFAFDPAHFGVIWYFQGSNILNFVNSTTKANPRYSLNQNQALTGTADLMISDMSISDVGIYQCVVVYSPVRLVMDITVDIQAPPQITITGTTVTISNDSVLRSSISGFYPEKIDIKWLRDGEILDNVIVEKPQRLPDGTYSVTSSVTVTPTEEDRGRTFSCRVQHESLTQPLQEDFTLVCPDKEESSTNVVVIAVPVVCVVAVIIAAGAVGIYLYCKKSGQQTGEDRRETHTADRAVIYEGVKQEEKAERSERMLQDCKDVDVKTTRKNFENKAKKKKRRKEKEHCQVN
ncbi:tyrosine-protein phosphatase non-receptor type substrate 1-like [Hyperolius riggenbachi]|uniref:tyrosine-protein phosphatase non-receptor type substrate 1-like n=1 Tax=Hyperolius riggenbachi TaxID=752182 RepID=UPI0035A2C054